MATTLCLIIDPFTSVVVHYNSIIVWSHRRFQKCEHKSEIESWPGVKGIVVTGWLKPGSRGNRLAASAALNRKPPPSITSHLASSIQTTIRLYSIPPANYSNR